MSLLPLLAAFEERDGEPMTLLMMFVALLVVLAIAALMGKVPDSHRETCQHGDFDF